MEIAPNLFVLGVGGSAPAYDRDGQLIWKGYPDQEKDIAIDKAMGCAQTIPDSASVCLFLFVLLYRLFFSLTVLHPSHHQVK